MAESGKIVTRSTVHSLSVADNASPVCIQRKKDFTEKIEAIIGNYSQATIDNADSIIGTDPYANLFEDDEDDDDDIEFQELDENGQPVSVSDFEPTLPNDHVLLERDD